MGLDEGALGSAAPGTGGMDSRSLGGTSERVGVGGGTLERVAVKSPLSAALLMLVSCAAFGAGGGRTFLSMPHLPPGVPSPAGIYVLDDASNEKPSADLYATGLFTSAAYRNDVTGHAIFVPLAKILPVDTLSGQFNWDWRFLDTLVQFAVGNGKKFSIELETGYQSSDTYLHSLPYGFVGASGPGSAPLFDVWTTGGASSRCVTAYVLLPWVPGVQEFWTAAAGALSTHLKQSGVYDALTLVHVPGLSVYDEEIRLPTGVPRPTTADTLPCPDGRRAYPAVIDDADTGRWRGLGYSDSAVVNGFRVIAKAFADAFPDRVIALSLFPPGQKGIDFPNLTRDSAGYVAGQIVREVTAIAPGRVQIQADNLDGNYAEAEVMNLASMNSDLVGWQSNKHGGPGAGCNGGGAGSCGGDGSASPYFQLLKNGSLTGGEYVEVWSADVVSFPLSFAAAASAGFYSVTGVTARPPAVPAQYTLEQNYPNPFNPTTSIRYEIPEQAFVSLKIYDEIGREVETLVSGRRPAGSFTARFDASGLASGVYICRLQAGGYSLTRAMMLLK